MPRHDTPDGGDQQWKTGDMALCVRLSACAVRCPVPEPGKIYTVAGVTQHEFFTGNGFEKTPRVALLLEDAPDNNKRGPLWPAYNFRKINPLSEADRLVISSDVARDSLLPVDPSRKLLTHKK